MPKIRYDDKDWSDGEDIRPPPSFSARREQPMIQRRMEDSEDEEEWVARKSPALQEFDNSVVPAGIESSRKEEEEDEYARDSPRYHKVAAHQVNPQDSLDTFRGSAVAASAPYQSPSKIVTFSTAPSSSPLASRPTPRLASSIRSETSDSDHMSVDALPSPSQGSSAALMEVDEEVAGKVVTNGKEDKGKGKEGGSGQAWGYGSPETRRILRSESRGAAVVIKQEDGGEVDLASLRQDAQEIVDGEAVAMALRGGASPGEFWGRKKGGGRQQTSAKSRMEKSKEGAYETKFGRAMSFNHDQQGNILVEIPSFSSNAFDWIDPHTPASRKLTEEYAKSKKREDIPFVCTPAVPINPDLLLSPEAHALRCRIISQAVVIATRKGYGGMVLRFLAYCDKENIDPILRLPSDGNVVLNFLCTQEGKRLGTIKRYLSGISFWNGIHGIDLIVPPKLWDLIKKGLKKSEPKALVKRRALSLDDLACVVEGLRDDDGGEVALRAALLIAFFGVMRCAELTVPTLSGFNKEFHASPNHLFFYDKRDGIPAHAEIQLPWDKTHGHEGRDVPIFPQGNKPHLDPLAALKEHIFFNNPPPEGPLFAYRSNKDPNVYRPVTKSYFRDRVSQLLVADGREKISGYEVRVGGCNYYLHAGMNPMKVQELGGWSSPVFARYWREMRVISGVELVSLGLIAESKSKTDWELDQEEDPEMEGDDSADESEEEKGGESEDEVAEEGGGDDE